MRPHDETRNDVGARIPLGRTPLPPTASRTRRKTDLSIKMSRADNIGWTLDNTAFLPTSTCLSLKSWPYREYPIMFTQIPPSDHIIVRCIPTSLHARRLTLATRRYHRTPYNGRKTAAAFTQTRKICYVHFNATLYVPLTRALRPV